MKKLLTVLFISTVMVFAGCEKEGPEGPAGPQGPQGNANVKTEHFEVAGNEWDQVGTSLFYNHSSSIVTNDIIENGMVHTYIKLNRTQTDTTKFWIELPFSGISSFPTNNNVEIQSGVDLTTTTYDFKVVTVSGNLQAKVDFSNYEEVKAHFNLAD